MTKLKLLYEFVWIKMVFRPLSVRVHCSDPVKTPALIVSQGNREACQIGSREST